MALSIAVPGLAEAGNLASRLDQHLNWLRVKAYSDYTVRNRRVHIRFFLRWCAERRITIPHQITSRVLQDYQQHTLDYRKRNGEPLAVASRHARLVPLRVWFRWMAKTDIVAGTNLAEAIELPKLGRALPRNILSPREIARVMAQPNTRTIVGLRDRAILQLLYSTGIRRLELVHLKIPDCEFDRRLLFIREGKGKKDRYIPLGRHATYWLRRYIRHARPTLLGTFNSDAVFLSSHGRPLSRDHVTYIAGKCIASAEIGKDGACHLFRHSMATLMHENGADIRHVQQILGHADIRTTQIYAQVAIRTLQRVHAATHPGA